MNLHQIACPQSKIVDFLKRILIVLTAILVLGIIFLTTMVNWVADSSTKESLEAASGLEAKLRSARIGIFSGAQFNNIALLQPGDEDEPIAMWRANSIHVDAEPESLLHDSVFAENIRISGISLLLDREANGKSNYSDLIARWNTLFAAAKQSTPSNDSGDNERRYSIKQITLVDINTRAILRGPTANDVSIKTESLKLDAVGEKKAMTLTELSATVMYATLHHIAHRERDIPAKIRRDLRLQLAKLPKPDAQLESYAKNIGEQVSDQGNAFFDRAIEAIDKLLVPPQSDIPAAGDEDSKEQPKASTSE